MKKRVIVGPVGALLLAVSLAACATGGQASGGTASASASQGVGGACAIAEQKISTFSDNLAKISAEAATDPAAAVAKLKDITAGLPTVDDFAGDPKVAAAWQSVVTSFDDVTTAAQNSDLKALTSSGKTLLDAGRQLSEVCEADSK